MAQYPQLDRARSYSSSGSLAGENLLDFIGGSGPTLIATEQTGRRAFLMEMDMTHCDVIVQRHELFTGKMAKRVAADGVAGTDVPEKTPAIEAGVVAPGAEVT